MSCPGPLLSGGAQPCQRGEGLVLVEEGEHLRTAHGLQRAWGMGRGAWGSHELHRERVWNAADARSLNRNAFLCGFPGCLRRFRRATELAVFFLGQGA